MYVCLACYLNIWTSVKHISLNIKKRYNMEQYIVNGYVGMEINNAVYGLTPTGKILKTNLSRISKSIITFSALILRAYLNTKAMEWHSLLQSTTF